MASLEYSRATYAIELCPNWGGLPPRRSGLQGLTGSGSGWFSEDPDDNHGEDLNCQPLEALPLGHSQNCSQLKISSASKATTFEISMRQIRPAKAETGND